MLPLVFMVTTGCDDAHVVACFGDQDFCERVITANIPPEADAGTDGEVAAGDTVTLDGTGSTDVDGRITGYSWTQLSGTTVALSDADRPTASFEAPALDVPETLVFRLTVVDDDQAAAEDDVSVDVLPVVTSAVRAGFSMLTRSLAPEPVQVPESCTASAVARGSAWFAHAGLWLTAHTAILSGDADPDDVTRFLDAARVLLAAGAERSPPGPVAASIWDQGLASLRRYALDRDPALADQAMGLQPPAGDGSPVERLRQGRITLALAHNELSVVPLNPANATAMAVASIRHARCEGALDPVRLAADTIYLLSPGP